MIFHSPQAEACGLWKIVEHRAPGAAPAAAAGDVDGQLGDACVALARAELRGGREGGHLAAVLGHRDGVAAVEPLPHVFGGPRLRLEGGDAVGDAFAIDARDRGGVFQARGPYRGRPVHGREGKRTAARDQGTT
jgi:hypothetical protein